MNRRRVAAISLSVGILALAGAGAWYFLRDQPPIEQQIHDEDREIVREYDDEDATPEESHRFARSLSRLAFGGDKELRPLLTKYATHREPVVRRQMVLMLGTILEDDDADGWAAVEKALADNFRYVRIAGTEALGLRPSPRRKERLLEILDRKPEFEDEMAAVLTSLERVAPDGAWKAEAAAQLEDLLQRSEGVRPDVYLELAKQALALGSKHPGPRRTLEAVAKGEDKVRAPLAARALEISSEASDTDRSRPSE